ncbi:MULTISPECIES: hypothetical protein [unclassified Halomonas]|uniref:DUF997 family protein n=1 Tax=Halomonas sp. RT37 TaxID=2950872 RepID=A0AAU7KCV1_9GAMM|nr:MULTISPECIES: hypothetical protein [unclassified Halomonas]MBY5942794.1 hypothetical protein [Halomonas sp. DP5N14-9]MCO7217863.1 hypothetical protein [Halomonas sp. OfavH-34-E]
MKDEIFLYSLVVWLWVVATFVWAFPLYSAWQAGVHGPVLLTAFVIFAIATPILVWCIFKILQIKRGGQ